MSLLLQQTKIVHLINIITYIFITIYCIKDIIYICCVIDIFYVIYISNI